MINKFTNRNYFPILLILFTAVFVLVFWFFNIYISKKPSEAPTSIPSNIATTSNDVYEIPFDYEVISISAGEINLLGRKGKVILSAYKSEIYKGAPEEAKPVSLSDLTPGQKVKVRTVPGKRSWIYILD